MSSEDELATKLKSGLQALQMGKVQPSRDKKLLKSIRRLKADKTARDLALLAAQWILLYHTMNTMQAETKKEAVENANASKEDMPVAMALLDQHEFAELDERMTVLFLKSDICQRMPDFLGLTKIYDELKTMDVLDPRLQVIVLSAAPILGNWNQFMQHCTAFYEAINSKIPESMLGDIPRPDIQDVLHQLTETGLPDFGIVYDLVKNMKLIESRRGAPKPQDLYHETVDVKNVKLDIDSVSTGGEEDKEQELREQFNSADSSEFNFENMSFTVNGSLILVPGISAQIPVQLVGVYVPESEDITLEGYVDLQMPKLDEEGNPMLPEETPEMKLTPDMLPAEVQEAFATGQITPEIIAKIPPEAMEALQQNMMGMQAAQASITATIRQREKLIMKRKADGSGYSGKYHIVNVPIDTTTNKPMDEGETSIVFNIDFECKLLPDAPAHTVLADNEVWTEKQKPAEKKSDDDVAKVASGIDDLDLD